MAATLLRVSDQRACNDGHELKWWIVARTFLHGSAIATTGASLLEATSAFVEQAKADGGSPIVGPDATPITLNVNGVARSLPVAPNTTLAEVLRDALA